VAEPRLGRACPSFLGMSGDFEEAAAPGARCSASPGLSVPAINPTTHRQSREFVRTLARYLEVTECP